MDETRTALQDKLETLEQQVKNTVQEATEAVSDTVSTVKDAVQDTVDTVKDTVQETVETVKGTFDIAGHVEAHPWPMVLGATAVGFMVGRLLKRWETPTLAVQSAPRHTVGMGTANGFAYSETPPPAVQAPPKASWWKWLNDHYGEEINKLKGLALGTVGGMIREMATSSAPPAMAAQIKEMVDSTTVKMGGKLVEGPILSPSKPDVQRSNPTEESHYPATQGRATSAAW